MLASCRLACFLSEDQGELVRLKGNDTALVSIMVQISHIILTQAFMGRSVECLNAPLLFRQKLGGN